MQGLKSRYDFVFSIGAACSCSSSLRGAGLQYASYPFDWVVGGSLLSRARALAEDFQGWFEKEDLVNVMAPPWHTKNIYRNARTEVVFNHDFPKGRPFDDSYPEVADKYRRRENRLVERINAATRALAIYVQVPNNPAVTESDLYEAFAVLDKRFPGKIELLCCTNVSDRRFDSSAYVALSEHVHWLKFDYRAATSDEYGVGVVDEKRMSKTLAKVLGGVPDYRTRDERRAHRQRRKAARFAKLKARNRLEYSYRSLIYKLFKHFLNRLERWGVEI